MWKSTRTDTQTIAKHVERSKARRATASTVVEQLYYTRDNRGQNIFNDNKLPNT